MNKPDYRALEAGIKRVLECLDNVLSVSDTQEVMHFIDVGEYGIALETLCGVIIEKGYTVPRIAFHEIEKLAGSMKLQPEFWEPIKVYVK